MVLRPQVHGAVVVRFAVDPERVQVERRAHGPEPEAGDVGIGRLATQQIDQQGGEQRPVHHQARVALDLGHVPAVVVDAVPVERQRRVPELQDVVGHDLALPRRAGAGGRRWRLHLVR